MLRFATAEAIRAFATPHRRAGQARGWLCPSAETMQDKATSISYITSNASRATQLQQPAGLQAPVTLIVMV